MVEPDWMYVCLGDSPAAWSSWWTVRLCRLVFGLRLPSSSTFHQYRFIKLSPNMIVLDFVIGVGSGGSRGLVGPDGRLGSLFHSPVFGSR